jgi:hypothetical protein
VTGQATKRLRAPKVTPVPDPIIALAQQSWDGVKDEDSPDGELLHVLRHEFSDEAVAKEFAKHMRKAGEHTTPMTSLTVIHDPDGVGNTKVVAWKAGTRRGKAVTK